MSFSWFIARRYLTARRRQAFISLISAVSVLGVGVGVMAVIIALALMTGVQSEMRDRIVGSTAHVYVYKTAGYTDVASEVPALMVPGVVGAAPAVAGAGMLQSSRVDAQAVRIKGIDPVLEPQVTELETALRSGTLSDLVPASATGIDGIVLGDELATSLGVSVADEVLLMTAHGIVTPSGAVPTTRRFRVVATVHFGFYEVDAGTAFVGLDAAQDVLGLDGPDFIQLRLANLEDAPRIRQQLQETLGHGYDLRDWTQLNAPLYEALWLEKVAISLTIGLVVLVAALNIVASLVLLVMEKSRDIAILRTMGAPARAIRRIFILQGLMIGLAGTLAGTVLGLTVCIVADRYKLLQLPGDVYQITHVPFRVQPLDVTFVVVAAILVCLLATIYPSRQAGRLDPAEALRHQ